MTSPTLRVVFGDQLTPSLSALSDLDRQNDTVLFAETIAETTHVRHSKRKLVFFLSAMRHFAQALREGGVTVHYAALETSAHEDHSDVLEDVLTDRPHARIVVTGPGDHRVLSMVKGWESRFGVPVEIRRDDRFISDIEEFGDWADSRRELRLEDFYRLMRRQTGLLMDGDEPVGGRWNFDSENRKPPPRNFSADPPHRVAPDSVTHAVISLVDARFTGHPGTTEDFDLAVTAAEAERALDTFIGVHLPTFGDYQDAMVAGEATLHHSVLSAYLNVGLLTPLAVARRAEAAYLAGDAPLNAVEGFIRQVIGWREFVRGIYWHFMPDYAGLNALGADRPLPDLFWSGKTEMACLEGSLKTIHERAYTHHIERLMVTGLFAQLYGADPYALHEWHMALYTDAIDWVSLPNTLGMSQYGDGGIVGTKPYCASGQYIKRMSNYCSACRFEPKQATGARACPFTTLYWDFLDRHRERFAGNRRMMFQLSNLKRKDAAELAAIRTQASALRERLADAPS